MLIGIRENQHYILHPRPVYLVLVKFNEKLNVMTASWIMPVSEEPPRISLAIDRESYTYELIMKSKMFSVNVPSPNMVDIAWRAGTTSGRRVDKIRELNLELEQSDTGVPYIKGALGYIIARMHKTLSVGETDLIIADVIEAKADDRFFDVKRGWLLTKTSILLHNAGRCFVLTGRLAYPSR